MSEQVWGRVWVSLQLDALELLQLDEQLDEQLVVLQGESPERQGLLAWRPGARVLQAWRQVLPELLACSVSQELPEMRQMLPVLLA